jgi:hypothetical protein
MREARWDPVHGVFRCCQRTVISRCPNCPYAAEEAAAEAGKPVSSPEDSRHVVATLTIDRTLCLRIGQPRAVHRYVVQMLDKVFDQFPNNSYDKITLNVELL